MRVAGGIDQHQHSDERNYHCAEHKRLKSLEAFYKSVCTHRFTYQSMDSRSGMDRVGDIVQQIIPSPLLVEMLPLGERLRLIMAASCSTDDLFT